MKAEKVVESVAYLARLSPMAEQYDGFGKNEMAKAETALLEYERSNAKNGIQPDPAPRATDAER